MERPTPLEQPGTYEEQADAQPLILWTSEIVAHDPKLSLNADALLQWFLALLGL